jgi:secretion/DNA translocation related TadE-like protein
MTRVTAAGRERDFASRSGIATGLPRTDPRYDRSAKSLTRPAKPCYERPWRAGVLSRVVRDRGSATIWVLTCSTLVLLLALAVAIRAAAALARHEAETAADLAALAAASRIGYVGDAAGICAAAEAIVKANGGLLLACSAALQPNGLTGTVSVRAAVSARLPVVGHVRASASARAARLPANSTLHDSVTRPAVRAPPAGGRLG